MSSATIPGSEPAPLLDVRDLVVRYRLRRSVVEAVRSVSFTVAPGETVAVVGESGSGKSTTAHAVLGLLPPAAELSSGSIGFGGQDLTRLGERHLRGLRGREIALIPQDPGTALNPVHRIGRQVAEALITHGITDRRGARAAVLDLLADAGVPDPRRRAGQFPHELSGGLRQRVLIAIAVAARPRLIVADEPTSALDVIVQRQILDHIQSLTRAAGTSVLLITHDLGVAAERSDRVLVMAQGEVVEDGLPESIVSAPTHPYTKALVAAAPGRGPRPPARPAATVREPGGPAPEASDAFAAPTGPVQISAEHLVKEYRLPRAAGERTVLRAVDDVSLTVPRGETLALVGESGSGKSTVARLLLRLTTPTSGRVYVDGEDVTAHRGRELRALRRRMQIVHQNPYAALNPRLTVGQIVADPLTSFGLGTRRQRTQRAAELIDLVALPATALERRPSELSGGQRQRVAIARALALNPGLLVCDEPVSALDVSVQAQILDLLAELQARLGLSCLFISHDLAVVRQIAHRVGVMRAGRLVEEGPAEQVLTRPGHPYTEALLAAIPGREQLGQTGQPSAARL
ncbi:ABC transporter ATP-binding protein [Streptomyces sp. NBC_00683]|uniref:ABC transporter ATP-binding protein n=1 Tax=Streptomyces sp. NBC_00683 TaxID=2903670 RepID=UPI002E35DEC9|nr:ABC transporter ATP-binding protein [Streptomyces sp. NBC_00683]